MKTIFMKITCSMLILSMVISTLPVQVFAIGLNDEEFGIDIPEEIVGAVEGNEEDPLNSELKNTDEVDTSSFESADGIEVNSRAADQGQTVGTVDGSSKDVGRVSDEVEIYKPVVDVNEVALTSRSDLLELVGAYLDDPTTSEISGISNTDIAYPATGGNIYFNLETGTITGSDTNITEVIIPSIIDGVTVSRIENVAFSGCEELTKVTIPSSVTSIGAYAFCDCFKLTNISIPDSVTSIGNGAFSDCRSLAEIVLPANITNIGAFTFYKCTGLTNITIPVNVDAIEESAFSLSGLTSITIPNRITSICESTFAFCVWLTDITIPVSVTSIAYSAFNYCSNLADVYYIGSEANWAEVFISSNNSCLTNATIHYNSTKPADYRILVYASKPLLANKVGDIIDFCCGIYATDGQVIGWTNPSIVADNPNLVYISGYYEEDSHAYFRVKGLAEGTCTLTITDSATGIYGKVDLCFGSGVTSTKSYRIDQIPNFIVDESTWLFGQAQTQTNFYNVNGLYVNQFASNYNAATDKFDVSFSVYNSRYYNGAVDVFDASGKWIETYEIAKVTSARSIRDTFGDGWNLAADLIVEKKGLSYTLSSSAKKTSIKLSVPKGGYFTISNNYVESPGVFMFNVLEYIALSANTIFDLGLNLISGDSMDISVLSSFKKTTKDAILDSEFLSDQFMSTMRSYALKAAETTTRFSIGETAGVMTCSFEELLKSLDIDLEFIAKTELGIAESAFRKLTGPIGVGFNAMFSISKYGDLTTQTIEYLNSSNKPYIIIYATEDAYTNSTVNGVTVDDRTDSIDKEAVLQVFKLEYEEAIPVIEEKEIPTG